MGGPGAAAGAALAEAAPGEAPVAGGEAGSGRAGDRGRAAPPRAEAHPIRRANRAYIALACVLSRRALPALLGLLGTVSWKFFITQHLAKLFPKRIPLVPVDHPLDRSLPFEPERSGVYLTFIPSWIRALSWARRRAGRRANGAVAAYLRGLSACYSAAYSVYRRRVSTTERPAKAANADLRMIYAVDPHLYCVPSLHVMIVLYNWLAFRDLQRALGTLDAEAEEAARDLYEQAVEITDSILYVKQHSINCIPAALYMVSAARTEAGGARAAEGDFGPAEAEAFMERLIPGEARRAEIMDYMRALYRRFMYEGAARAAADRAAGREPDPGAVLVDFLDEYARGAAERARA